MKILLTLFMTLALFGANAQTMVDTGKVWNVVECLNFSSCHTSVFTFGADTTIGIYQYKKLIVGIDSGGSFGSHPIAAREDTSSKQVFFYKGGNEYLAYDFSLNQGDTFASSIGVCQIQMVVDSVDSVTLLNGETRKRMFLADFWQETWIEGVGSLYGPTYVGLFFCTFDLFTELNCFKVNDTMHYQNTNYSSCYYSTVGANELSSRNLFTIFPNPTSDFISIRSDNSEKIKSIVISNVFGEILLTTDKTDIDLSGFATGMYFVQAETDGGNYIAKVLRK